MIYIFKSKYTKSLNHVENLRTIFKHAPWVSYLRFSKTTKKFMDEFVLVKNAMRIHSFLICKLTCAFLCEINAIDFMIAVMGLLLMVMVHCCLWITNFRIFLMKSTSRLYLVVLQVTHIRFLSECFTVHLNFIQWIYIPLVVLKLLWILGI